MSQSNFNPRSREGSDHCRVRCVRADPYFNPRSREGSDQDIRQFFRVPVISIHAPVKGATVIATTRSWPWSTFQSTLP